QGTHFEIGPPTLQRQEVHQRADGRTSEMGVTEGSVIYQTESLAPIRHLQKSSARQCVVRVTRPAKRDRSHLLFMFALLPCRARTGLGLPHSPELDAAAGSALCAWTRNRR